MAGEFGGWQVISVIMRPARWTQEAQVKESFTSASLFGSVTSKPITCVTCRPVS